MAGLIAGRLSLPPLVGYLIAGYVLHGLKVAVLPNLAHLADIGIELLLRSEVLSVGGSHLLLVTGIFIHPLIEAGSQLARQIMDKDG
jgi:predicted Kef-type K+ transport protein